MGPEGGRGDWSPHLEVPSGVEGGDEPVLLLHLPLLRREEVDHVLVPQVRVGEDVLLVLPGGVLLAGEDLHGHRFKLLRRGLPQPGLVHLGEATFPHLERAERHR